MTVTLNTPLGQTIIELEKDLDEVNRKQAVIRTALQYLRLAQERERELRAQM